MLQFNEVNLPDGEEEFIPEEERSGAGEEEEQTYGYEGTCSELKTQSSEQLTIWETLVKQFNSERDEVVKYRCSKENVCEVEDPPMIRYMESRLLYLLKGILEEMFDKAIETESLKYQKSPFNGLDYIAQLLWNYNPLYPERREENLFIHDMDWVKEILKENPRPYFPLSWIFTKEIAATKIQAYVRGFLVRKRDDVQEMRQFWKAFKRESLSFRASIANYRKSSQNNDNNYDPT